MQKKDIEKPDINLSFSATFTVFIRTFASTNEASDYSRHRIYQNQTVMKLIQTSFFRAAVALIVGALLIKYRQETVIWLTVSIGMLFFLSGLITCIVYYVSLRADRPMTTGTSEKIQTDSKPTFPIAGLGSLILGVILALAPYTISDWMTSILGAILILGSIGQYASLAGLTKLIRIRPFYWLMPSVMFLVGLISIIKPDWLGTAPLFIIGWTMMLYGIVECINTFKAMNIRRRIARQASQSQQDAVSFTETQPMEETQRETTV